jgi:hypothetical protein
MGYQIKVDVTQEDIDTALRKNSSRCVVATAIARTVPKAMSVTVDVHSIRFTEGGRRYTYLTPHPVMDYIVAFDAGDTLHPFTFRLRTDQRLVQQRTRKTPVGKAVDAAGAKVRDRKAKLEKVAAAPDATPAEIEVAADRYAEALAARDQVAAAHADVPRNETESITDVPPEQVKPVPQGRSTVFYRNRRVYGQRQMRVNQHDDQPGDFRGPLDTAAAG